MRILVPLDISDITNVVLRTVKRIAEAHKGEVILFHAVSPAFYIPYPESLTVDVIDVKVLQEIEEKKKSEAKEKLQGFADFMKPVDTTIEIEVGDPRDLILEMEDREDPDLVVIGSHKKGLVEKILIGSTAEKIVKHSFKPILVIKGSEPTFEGRAVIAYDFSKTAERMLDFAIDFLRPFNMKVELLHIDEPFDLPIVERIGRAIYQRFREEKRKYMDRIRDRFKEAGIDPEVTYLDGMDPKEAIVSRIKELEDVDLLIMGSRGLSGLKRIILGSTSTEVLRQVEIPILIYKDGARG